VAAAIDHADSGGIPVVAAAGDRGGTDDTNPKPYPAAYSGVIGVSAIDVSGARWAKSGHGGFVDIAAPGVSVLTTWRGQDSVSATGTGPAAGFVAAAAALVRQRWRTFGPASVRRQLRANATPAAGGEGSPDFGAGIVSPYGAVTGLSTTARPAAAPAFSPRTPGQAEQDWAAAWATSGATAVKLTLVAIGLVLLLLVVAVAVPRGRRRSWRPTLAPAPVDVPEPEELGPPVQLFGDN
jgi:membrane-anchored mycosin MYCP